MWSGTARKAHLSSKLRCLHKKYGTIIENSADGFSMDVSFSLFWGKFFLLRSLYFFIQQIAVSSQHETFNFGVLINQFCESFEQH